MVVRRGLLGVFAVLFFSAGCEEQNAYVAPPPPKVTVAEPLQQDVTEYLEFTGTMAASAKVEVRARVSGVLEEVLFTAGTSVSAGDPLFKIDPKEYEADLSSAEADLQAATAELSQAADELARSEKLLKKQAVAEVRVLEWKTKKAVADANKRQANAALERARLNLGYTSIMAPIEGRVSRELVDKGNLVGEGEPTHLTTVTDYDPIYVYFNVNELDLLRIIELFRQKVKEKGIDPAKESSRQADIPLQLGLVNEVGYPHNGFVDYGDSGLDSETGTLQVRGIFVNSEKPPRLFPGLFVRVRMPIQEREGALLVTERAIGADQSGRYLLIVNSENEVEKRVIRTGQNVDGLLVIEEGLEPGEKVVVKGLQRARPGGEVEPEAGDMAAFKISNLRGSGN